jgi:hypothetical protein
MAVENKWVRLDADAPCVENGIACNGKPYKMSALEVTTIKSLIDQGARVYEVKEVKEGTEVVGYEDVLLTEENYDQDNSCLPVPENETIIPDLDKQLEEKHAAEWEAHLAEIGQEIKAEQDEKQKEFFPTTEIEGEGEGATNPPADNPQIPLDGE